MENLGPPTVPDDSEKLLEEKRLQMVRKLMDVGDSGKILFYGKSKSLFL